MDKHLKQACKIFIALMSCVGTLFQVQAHKKKVYKVCNKKQALQHVKKGLKISSEGNSCGADKKVSHEETEKSEKGVPSGSNEQQPKKSKFSKQEVDHFLKMLNDPHFAALFDKEHALVKQDLASGDLRSSHEAERKKFYTEYLARFYPKAFVIRDRFFANMTVAQMTAALKEIIELFADEPWFYFSNSKKGFVFSHYLEHVVDQCSILSDFIKKAKVDQKTKKISFSENSSESSGVFGSLFSMSSQKHLASRKQLMPLTSKLSDDDKAIIAEFYALCFDFVIKLFNQGVMNQDHEKTMRFYDDLIFIATKLRGTAFESSYDESLKTCRELMDILRQRLPAPNETERNF